MDVSRLLGVLTATIKSVQTELNDLNGSADKGKSSSSDIAVATLTPFIADLNKLRIMLIARKGDEVVRDRIRAFITDLDDHLRTRLMNVAKSSGSEDVLADLTHVLPSNGLRTEHKEPSMDYKLLKTVGHLVSEDADLPTPAPAVADTVKVPDSVIASIKKRIGEIQAKIDTEIERKEKSWTYFVPASTTPKAETLRLRIGDDRAVEMLEMLLAYLSNSPTATDLKMMTVKFQSYDNLTRHQIPDDVLKFMLVASQWGALKAPKVEYKEVKNVK